MGARTAIGRPACIVCAVTLALVACVARAGASAAPGLEITAGGTFGISGNPDSGGWSVALSPMWTVEDRILFGVTFFADDIGTEIGRLRDPNDGTDLGATELGHTYVLGTGWRLDREWGSLLTWMPYASGTWGYYNVTDDRRGSIVHRTGSTGFSLAGGVRRAVGERYAVGTSVRYHRLFNDRLGRYVEWAVDWSFR